jgi:hypothetical protein
VSGAIRCAEQDISLEGMSRNEEIAEKEEEEAGDRANTARTIVVMAGVAANQRDLFLIVLMHQAPSTSLPKPLIHHSTSVNVS